MVTIVDDLNLLAAAIESEGASSVYWYADRTRLREGVALGLLKDNLLAKQALTLEEALALWDDAKLYAPKKVAKKATPKKKVVEDVAEKSLD